MTNKPRVSVQAASSSLLPVPPNPFDKKWRDEHFDATLAYFSAKDSDGLPVGRQPHIDDAVIAETHVLVPRDFKCHKCRSSEPWKDAERSSVPDEIESWLIDLRELAATAFRENGHSHAGMGELLGCQDCADIQSAGINLTNTMRDWLPKLLAERTQEKP